MIFLVLGILPIVAVTVTNPVHSIFYMDIDEYCMVISSSMKFFSLWIMGRIIDVMIFIVSDLIVLYLIMKSFFNIECSTRMGDLLGSPHVAPLYFIY